MKLVLVRGWMAMWCVYIGRHRRLDTHGGLRFLVAAVAAYLGSILLEFEIGPTTKDKD
jgi:hypothetical protein